MQNITYIKVEPHQVDLMEQIFRLRYEVYVKECGFIAPPAGASGLEQDEYDAQAVHFAAVDPSVDRVVASMRLIVPGRRHIPMQKCCRHLFWFSKQNKLRQVQWGEISRFVVAKDFRRNKLLGSLDVDSFDEDGAQRLFSSHGIAAGLCKEIYKESMARGLTHWGALMEKGLWGLLRMYGFRFKCIGEEVNVAGPVRPYVATLKDIRKSILNHEKRFLNTKFVSSARIFLPQADSLQYRFA
jgi:N-acyl amino acid synthase of PEP-CTERM/exosortase system